MRFFLLVFLINSDLESKIVEAIVALNSPRKLGLTGAVHFVDSLKMFLFFFYFHISQVGAKMSFF